MVLSLHAPIPSSIITMNRSPVLKGNAARVYVPVFSAVFQAVSGIFCNTGKLSSFPVRPVESAFGALASLTGTKRRVNDGTARDVEV